MAKDGAPQPDLNELSDAEIARIEATLFCAGGPPRQLSVKLAERAARASARVTAPTV